MQCTPLPQLTVTTPGTPVSIASTTQCAALTIQAAASMTGTMLITSSGAVIAQLAPGATWSTPATTGGNPIRPSDFAIDATTGASNATAIVTAWIR